jgi:beta-phosphoglucomutase-like phosphatase (HAD superfamily)/GH25 family lysozyme M1 (1,4-beta-N-acetylmuramidase)
VLARRFSMGLVLLLSCGRSEVGYEERESVVCPSGSTLTGIDVSSWQGTIDWIQVASAGIVFAYVRATDGALADSRYAANTAGARAVGISTGAYHVFEPAQDSIDQAESFLSRAGPILIGDLPPALDLERTGDLSGSVVAAKALQFLRHVEQETGRKPLLYTAPAWFEANIGSPAGLETYPLWIAHWGGTCPSLPNGFVDWAVHQYSAQGSVSGVAGAVDMDSFNGVLPALQRLARPPLTDGRSCSDDTNCESERCVDRTGCRGSSASSFGRHPGEPDARRSLSGIVRSATLHEMLRAVLFDLDGTLVDTERESAEALRRVLVRQGVTMSPAELEFVIGHSWLQIHDLLRVDHGAAIPPLEELMAAAAAERELIFAGCGVNLLPGAGTVPHWLAARFQLAIVSGSSRREARAALVAAGLLDLFAVVFAAEDYAPGKPDPRGYLLAAEHLGAAPEECLVIEDSAAGVIAGRAAGMHVVAVRAGNFAGQDQSSAHRIVDTLEDIDAALISELFPGSGGGAPCQSASAR